MRLYDTEFIYSCRKNGVYRQGIGLLMNKEASKSHIGWKGINSRILVARFITKKCMVSVIYVYAPVESIDRESSDTYELDLQLLETIDRIRGRNLVFLVGILMPRSVEIG